LSRKSNVADLFFGGGDPHPTLMDHYKITQGHAQGVYRRLLNYYLACPKPSLLRKHITGTESLR